mmetsp:Transcript_24889/g.71403  ORF Transcript_24889/g.71403 Transcript_24889/m.71403 type:complete len:368 (+) Transcript_24889:1744-2847(+)
MRRGSLSGFPASLPASLCGRRGDEVQLGQQPLGPKAGQGRRAVDLRLDVFILGGRIGPDSRLPDGLRHAAHLFNRHAGHLIGISFGVCRALHGRLCHHVGRLKVLLRSAVSDLQLRRQLQRLCGALRLGPERPSGALPTSAGESSAATPATSSRRGATAALPQGLAPADRRAALGLLLELASLGKLGGHAGLRLLILLVLGIRRRLAFTSLPCTRRRRALMGLLRSHRRCIFTAVLRRCRRCGALNRRRVCIAAARRSTLSNPLLQAALLLKLDLRLFRGVDDFVELTIVKRSIQRRVRSGCRLAWAGHPILRLRRAELRIAGRLLDCLRRTLRPRSGGLGRPGRCQPFAPRRPGGGDLLFLPTALC